MPAATVIQMTDAETKPVRRVDKVLRKRWDRKSFMCYRLEHLRDFPRGNTVFLDADVVVRKDVAHVFTDDFDIGLTLRDTGDPSLRFSPEVVEQMPYNAGVMFARASGWDFWRDAWERCLAFGEDDRNWFGDQLAIKAAATGTPLNVRTYPCALYNYSPSDSSCITRAICGRNGWSPHTADCCASNTLDDRARRCRIRRP